VTFYLAKGRDRDGEKIQRAFASRAEALKEARARASYAGHDFRVSEITMPRISKPVLLDLYNARKPKGYAEALLVVFRPYGPPNDAGDRKVRTEKA
jgi:hypothetical protein